MAGSISRWAVVLGTLAFGAWQPASAQQAIKFNSFAPPQEPLTRTIFPEFMKNVTESSAGAVKFDYFPGGGLGRDPVAQLKLVLDGVADISLILPSNTPGRFPDNEITQLPFLVETSTEGSIVLWRLFEDGHIAEASAVASMLIAIVVPVVFLLRRYVVGRTEQA